MLSPEVDILEQYDGIILDATALIDFVYLGDWQWLQSHYAPLYIVQEVLDSDQLELETREVAQKYLIPIPLDTEEMFRSYLSFNYLTSVQFYLSSMKKILKNKRVET